MPNPDSVEAARRERNFFMGLATDQHLLGDKEGANGYVAFARELNHRIVRRLRALGKYKTAEESN